MAARNEFRTLSKSDFKAARTCPAKLYYREFGYPTTTGTLAMLLIWEYWERSAGHR